MVNLTNLVNFGSGGAAAIGDVVYSANTLTAPSYLSMVDETASYLASSYPALAALYTTPVTAYSAATTTTFTMAVNEMVYGNGIFIGVTSGVTPILSYVTSRDGVNWTQRSLYPNAGSGTTPGLQVEIYSIAFGNGTFVITTRYGNDTNTGSQVFTSIDGINWTRTQLLASAPAAFYPVYGNGVWIINAGNSGTWFRSIDSGVTWSTYYPASSTNPNKGRAFGNGVFVYYTGVAGTSAIARSLDQGNSWGVVTTPSMAFGSIAFGNGVFVAVDTSGSASTAAATSSDGGTWVARTLPTSSVWRAVTFGNGVFVAVSSTGTNAATSPDGITWTTRVLPNSGFPGQALCCGGPTNNKIFVFYPQYGSIGYTISLSVAQTTFTLPSMTTTTLKNMLPYVKAT